MDMARELLGFRPWQTLLKKGTGLGIAPFPLHIPAPLRVLCLHDHDMGSLKWRRGMGLPRVSTTLSLPGQI